MKKFELACQNNADRLRWLHRLPRVLADLENRWSLRVGEPFDGDEVSCAWVAPVTRADNTTAVLKLGIPHMEAEHEIEGLRFWAGDPTVRLVDADESLDAMLLERCEPGTWLRELPETEQDGALASLLRRLWRRPQHPHPLRPLAALAEYWSAECLAKKGEWLEPALVSEGLRLFLDLSRATSADVLLATDLHAGNVLRAQRAPWLVIDPKPFVGDPAFDATQHLLNCSTRLRADPRNTLQRFAGLLGLDCERVRLWTFARAAVMAGCNPQNSRWISLARAIRG